MSATAVEEVGTVVGHQRRTVWLTPAVILLLMGGLWAWVHSRTLDQMEAQALRPGLVLTDLWQHVELVAASTVVTVALGVSLGVLLTRPGLRRAGAVVVALANIGQAVPSIGVLVVLAMVFGVGFRMALVALVAYALLPVLRNTMVGITEVDPALIDAGRGMGMSGAQRLWRIELPLAVPVMLAGIRVALVLNVGVATLATFTDAGGLGSIISTGIALDRTTVLLVGCGLTVALALAVDWLAGLVEDLIRPKGI